MLHVRLQRRPPAPRARSASACIAFFAACIAILTVLILGLGAVNAFASESSVNSGGAEHQDPIAAVVLWLAVVLVGAMLGGHLAVLVKQPSVLGELCAGVVIGNLHHLGVTA